MKTRFSDEKEGRFLSDTFQTELNKFLNSQSNYGSKNQNQFTNLILNYDQFIPKRNNKLNTCLLNLTPLNYDFGFRSWLNVIFFTKTTMSINVVDNSSNLSKPVNNSPNVDNCKIEFNNRHLIPQQKLFTTTTLNSNLSNSLIKNNLNNQKHGSINLNSHNLSAQQQQSINQPIETSILASIIVDSKDQDRLKHLLAGAAAGIASRTCTAPLDRIKVLLQVKSSEIPSIRSCFKFIREEGGYRSFWRGNGINCFKICPEIALKFMFYEEFKCYIKGNREQKLAFYERFISGSLAGSLSQSIIYPLEVVKTRLCIRKTGQYKNFFDCIKKIYRIEGYRTFYRGFSVNLIGILPYSGIDLTVYETLKNLYLAHYEEEDPGFVTVFFCGLTSNISGQLFSYPLALMRTRMQALDDKKVGVNAIRKQIYNSYGLKGFYRGFIPNLIKVAPANAITYIVYEQANQIDFELLQAPVVLLDYLKNS